MPVAFTVFIIVPLLEMLLLFEVADRIGGIQTLLMVVLTAVIGVQVLKQQGFSTFSGLMTGYVRASFPLRKSLKACC